MLQFLFEAVILSLAGGLVGVLAGVGGSYLFAAVGHHAHRAGASLDPTGIWRGRGGGHFLWLLPGNPGR